MTQCACLLPATVNYIMLTTPTEMFQVVAVKPEGEHG